MTRLSRPSALFPVIGRNARLACLSLSAPVMLAGCLDPPPTYEAAERLPPVIQSWGVEPTLTRIVPIAATEEQVVFTVPFRSDDAGEPLKAFFIENIPQQVDFRFIIEEKPVAADPRPFSEQVDREVSFSWVTIGRTGCSTVTMLLSHASNFTRGWQMTDPLDSAQVTWTLEFLDSSGTSQGCILPGGAP